MSKRSDAVFGRIARRYDLLNTLLSAGRDQAWRWTAVAHLPMGRMLDLGSGTGAAAPIFGTREVVALDPVREMLALSPHPRRVVAIGEELPFADQSFDGVFSAYVVRNLSSLDATLAEVHRVLRPGGVAAFVDLARPRNRIWRWLHRIGTALTLPIAGLFARAPAEYWYLHRSLDKLAAPEELYSGSKLRLGPIWRMGVFGFVYGVALYRDD